MSKYPAGENNSYILLRQRAIPDLDNLDVYRQHGGFKVLEKAITSMKPDEVIDTMNDLVSHGCDILTIGQYLQPTKRHLPVDRFVTPDEFNMYKEEGLKIGFRIVESSPLVRSSYHADEQALL